MHKLVLGLLGLAAVATLNPRQSADEAPPLRLYLERGSERLDVQLDQPFELEVDGQKVALTLRAYPTRVLDIGSVSFEFPKDATFEFDDDVDSLRTWTIELPNAFAMVHRYSIPGLTGEAALDSLIDGMREQLPEGEFTPNDVVLRVGDTEIRGHRHRVQVGPTEIEQEYYLLLPTTGHPVLLMLQDSLTDDGDPTDDFVNLRALIEQTLRRRTD